MADLAPLDVHRTLLSEKDWRRIRNLFHNDGVSAQAIGKRFGVTSHRILAGLREGRGLDDRVEERQPIAEEPPKRKARRAAFSRPRPQPSA